MHETLDFNAALCMLNDSYKAKFSRLQNIILVAAFTHYGALATCYKLQLEQAMVSVTG